MENPTGPYGSDRFQADLSVSRETMDRLRLYEQLLVKWQRAVNLVSAKTLPDFWKRHALDSGQLIAHIPSDAKTIVDLGSGAGFPGLVLAILLADRPDLHVHLFESDSRKGSFLKTVIRETGAPATVHTERCEAANPMPADVITARAFAPLDRLLTLSEPFWGQNTVFLLLKGQDIDVELTDAAKSWKMRPEKIPSRSHPDGYVLRIDEVTHG